LKQVLLPAVQQLPIFITLLQEDFLKMGGIVMGAGDQAFKIL
jgi:hypothetical protein